MAFVCKKCRKAFRRTVTDFIEDEAAEYCPYCDNHFLLEAKLGKEPTFTANTQSVSSAFKSATDMQV